MALAKNTTVNDGSLVWIVRDSRALPLSGGTITDTIHSNALVAIDRLADNSSIEFHAASSYTKGAYLYLTGQDSDYSGRFTLAAANNGTIYRLTGTSDGLLTWSGNPVVTLTSGSSGLVPAILISKGGSTSSWYRKYSDGFIEQGGILNAGENANNVITFPIAMTTITYAIAITCNWAGSTGNGWGYAHTKTTSNMKVVTTSNKGQHHAWYIAGF